MTSLGVPAYRISTPRLQQSLAFTPFHEWQQPDGSCWCRFFRAEDGYLLRFPDLADFTVSRDGAAVTASPTPGADQATLDHLYLNQVLPLALSRQYRLVLHASAVEIDGRAVGFLGRSGQGKSTMATGFAAEGHRFLTDDGLQILKQGTGYVAIPGHPSLRLWHDSIEALPVAGVTLAPAVAYTPKTRLLAGGTLVHCDRPLPLRCLYLLETTGPDDQVRIEPCNGRSALMGLIGNSFLLDIEERDMLARHFGELSELAQAVGIYVLRYPRRFERMADVRAAIIRHSQSL